MLLSSRLPVMFCESRVLLESGRFYLELRSVLKLIRVCNDAF